MPCCSLFNLCGGEAMHSNIFWSSPGVWVGGRGASFFFFSTFSLVARFLLTACWRFSEPCGFLFVPSTLFGSSLPERVPSLSYWFIVLLSLSVFQRYALAFFFWSFFFRHSKGVLVGMLPPCDGDLFRGQGFGKVPKFPTFPALVREPRVENSLGCCVSKSGAFGHGWNSDNPRQLANVLDLYSNHGPYWSLDIGVRGFYIKDIPNTAGHDG